MNVSAPRPYPTSGEFFAPMPLLAVVIMVINDVWLKPRFHSELTGKLSDIAVCFLMPLFCSELLGIVWRVRPWPRLLFGAAFTAVAFSALEMLPPVTRLTLDVLNTISAYLGLGRGFRMTSDVTDLYCLALIPLAVAYGHRRLTRKTQR